MKVAYCESRLDARATSPAGDRGLFQIAPLHSARVGGDLSLLYDPEINANVAFQLYQERGWSPWVICSR